MSVLVCRENYSFIENGWHGKVYFPPKHVKRRGKIVYLPPLRVCRDVEMRLRTFAVAIGYVFVAMDLPGMGENPGWWRGHIHSREELLEIVYSGIEIAERFPGTENTPLYLTGSSAGGMAVLMYALRECREKHVGKISGVIEAGAPIGAKHVIPWYVSPHLMELWSDYLPYWPTLRIDKKNINHDPKLLEWIGRVKRKKIFWDGLADARTSYVLWQMSQDLEAHFDQEILPNGSPIPLLLMRGELDKTARSYARYADVPRVAVMEYPEKKHIIFSGEGAMVTFKDIEGWLNRLELKRRTTPRAVA